MNFKFISLLFISSICLSLLVYSATTSSSKSVVTVKELLGKKSKTPSIRLGAKVANKEIVYKTEPIFLLNFWVEDIPSEKSDDSEKVQALKNSLVKEALAEKLNSASSLKKPTIQVSYKGLKPDTFQAGRDVILEGNWSGEVFHATSLMTQCPSKYEPPSSPY